MENTATIIRVKVRLFDYKEGRSFLCGEHVLRYVGQDEINNAQIDLKERLSKISFPHEAKFRIERLDTYVNLNITCHSEYWDDWRGEAIEKIIHMFNEVANAGE